MNSPLQALADIIEGLGARKVLLCSHSELDGLAPLCEQLNCELHSALITETGQSSLPEDRFDIAIVANCLEHLGLSDGQHLLGRLRNLHTNHIATLYRPADAVSDEQKWQAGHFFAFAMQHTETFKRDDKDVLQLYTYDIESYNHTREWNNARFWANPEHFGRYWW